MVVNISLFSKVNSPPFFSKKKKRIILIIFNAVFLSSFFPCLHGINFFVISPEMSCRIHYKIHTLSFVHKFSALITIFRFRKLWLSKIFIPYFLKFLLYHKLFFFFVAFTSVELFANRVTTLATNMAVSILKIASCINITFK